MNQALSRVARVSVMVLSRRAFSAPPAPVPHYILTYPYPPTILEDRVPHRPGHVGLAKQHKAAGTLLYAGGLSSPLSSTSNRELPTEGVFLFNCEKAAEEFIEDDPYVKSGVVDRAGITIREWACVVTP
ncbi:hypothetical protein TrLO_g9990 [Triparma laevis f. longispina]|uniref:YCII-related domain-containing protein n=1 Tax=Triparma laevis f. longispina TaxID=1714387 RepID=A0A9W7EHH7_9STRA|nr:hypothetical protein TrLO_g9990 [Triparma laevis f. longispina]